MPYRRADRRDRIHTFEAVSDSARSTFFIALSAMITSATIALFGRVGGEITCTRNQLTKRCVLHSHYAGHTSQTLVTGGSIDSERGHRGMVLLGLHHGSGATATYEVAVPPDALVLDARTRDGRWRRGAAAFGEAALQFHEFDSPGYAVRHRSKFAPWTVSACLSLAAISAAILALSTARRRRYRLRFDPDADTVFASRGTLFALGPEREVKLSPTQAPTVRLTGHGAALQSGEHLLLDSPDAVELGLLDSLRRAMERARSTDGRTSSPLPVAIYAIPAALFAIIAVLLAGGVLRHMRSLPTEYEATAPHASQ
ncbi:MAG: hypothetical protein JNK05_35510 [Myxococcales bacterium]|nr:hypothetical protein [Myxococcales bacterium]